MESYYDSWSRLDTWRLDEGVRLVTEYVLFQQEWIDGATYRVAFSYKYSELYGKASRAIFSGELKVVQHQTQEVEEIDDDGLTYPVDITLASTIVDPPVFLEWAAGQGYKLPFDFNPLLPDELHAKKPPVAPDAVADEIAVKAIAKTLWGQYPKMTADAIWHHDAVQEIGNGRNHGEKKVKKWIREVDERPSDAKPGVKAKGNG